MVKLASARESRLYGPGGSRNRWECINSGVYVLAVFLLFAGFTAQLPGVMISKGGLVVVLIGLVLVAAVNLHDLFAHVAGVGYRIGMVRYDVQLGVVELLVPVVQFVGSVLIFVGVMLLLSQIDTEYDGRTKRHATNCLIAGPLLWVIGSIHNGCQIYERADSQTQILQTSVHVPFLMGSLLFFVAGFFNRRHAYADVDQRESRIVAKSWSWLCMFACLLFFLGGLFNILKVHKMQQGNGLRLEKLHGGAQERLNQIRGSRDSVSVEESSAMRMPTAGLDFKHAAVPVQVSVPPVYSP